MSQPTSRQADADMLAQQYKLGSLRTAYELARASFCGYIFTVLFALFFFLPLFLLLPAIQFKIDIQSIIVLLTAVLFPGVALFIIVRTIIAWIGIYRRRGSSLLLYTNGLILLQYKRQQLVFSDALHWQDVAQIWHEVRQKSGSDDSGAIINIYKIQNKQGDQFGGSSFEFSMKQLGRIVEQETFPHLWPSIVDTYERGRPVSFGPLSLSVDGIHYAEQSLPWQAVKAVHCNWKITIKQRSDTIFSSWARISDKDVPNIHLLYALLDFIRKQQAPITFSLEKKR